MTSLTVRGLVASRGGRRVLDGVDLDVRPGEVVALVGPSGCGKTTLLRCVNRLTEPDAGRILVDDGDALSMPPHELRRRVVLVAQESVMLPGTVRDNVAYGPSLEGPVDYRHIVECLRMAALPREMLDREASRLSGGERQRVALARALALRPEVLLLDEPTSEMDPERARTVERSVGRIARDRGVAVIWATHDVAQARRVADRIAALRGGLIVRTGPSDGFVWDGVYGAGGTASAGSGGGGTDVGAAVDGRRRMAGVRSGSESGNDGRGEAGRGWVGGREGARPVNAARLGIEIPGRTGGDRGVTAPSRDAGTGGGCIP